ncbi:hypothetical protein DXG03_003317 [Asterophora parasitica]|uniref:Uncharacterized protein n=1 Tax=Asterophora parasitica TaxID=117018 RepID=A0A9P7K9H8_9AGAR|nr:hypothetical protein DXG03_003317 [Asterophora parasitica]
MMRQHHPQNVGHEIDLFSPRSAYSDSSSSPCRLVGLGISGIPRKDGKRDEFDGLGLVGVRHSYYRNPFMADDEEDDGYTSPTPRRFHGHEDEADADEWVEEDVSDAVLSEAFLQELVYTWEADPMHMRFLATIPECAPEDEEDIIRKPLVMPAPPPVAARMNNTTIRSNNCRKLRTQAAPAVSAATRGRSAVRTGSSSGSASRRDKAMVSRGVSCAVARSRRG